MGDEISPMDNKSIIINVEQVDGKQIKTKYQIGSRNSTL